MEGLQGIIHLSGKPYFGQGKVRDCPEIVCLKSQMNPGCYKYNHVFFFVFTVQFVDVLKYPHMGDARNRANMNFWSEHTVTWNEDRIKRGIVPLIFPCLVQLYYICLILH